MEFVWIIFKTFIMFLNVFKKVHDISEEKEVINHESIAEMPYLEASIMETLRMFPPVIEHDRSCTKSCTVNNIPIQKGSTKVGVLRDSHNLFFNTV
jgi:cytochrome P450